MGRDRLVDQIAQAMADLNDPPGTVYEWVRQDNSPGDGWRRLDNGRPDCPIWIRPMEADR